MRPLAQVGLMLLVFGALAIAYMRWSSSYKKRVTYPRGQRKYIVDTYRQSNDIAKLLSDVLALKERSAKRPDILKTLNPTDEPQLRTVLLELRAPNVLEPHKVLHNIELVCLTAKRPDYSPTRLELLELAKTNAVREDSRENPV